MIKKYNKILLVILLFFILLFFAFVTKVDAKEVTLNELAEKVKEVEPNASYLYVIGEYAFTSEHLLTTQDVMLAARTIQVSDENEAYDEMAIIYIESTYDNQWNIDGLEYVSNVVGTTAEKEKYDIKYIDYVESFPQTQIQVNVDELVNDVYNTVDTSASNDKFEVAMENDEIKVTVLDATMSSVTALQGTGIASAAKNLLNEAGVGSVTIAIPNTTAKVEITAENLSQKLGDLDDLFEALAGTVNPTAGDLAGKSITVTIGLKEGYVAGNDTTFTVSVDKRVTVEVDELVNDVYNTVDTSASNDKFEVAMENDEIKVTVLDATMSSVTALQGTGIASAAKNLLNEAGVGSVTIAIPNTTAKVEITAENLSQKLGDLDDLFEALAGTVNPTAGDLAGKSVTITIGLENGYVATKETSFTVSFDKKVTVEVNELVDDVYNTIDSASENDKFVISMNDKDVNVTVLDSTMSSVTALQGTGIASAAKNLLNEEGVGTVTIAIPNTTAKVEITAENLSQKLGDLDDLFEALAGTVNPTAGDLAGKSVTIKIGLEDGYVSEEIPEFTVTFDSKTPVKVDELINDVYTTVDTSASNDKFEVSTENDTIKVTMLDTTMNSVTALQGTGIASAAQNLLNEEGVGVVTLAIPNTTAKVEITSSTLIQSIGELDELFIALAGNENATVADLIGKSISITIGLKDGYATGDDTTFIVNFN